VPRQAGAVYGASLTASQLRDFAQARVYLARLRGLVVGDASAARLAWLLQADIALHAGDASAAAAALSGARRIRPVVHMGAT
jgi:predicted Zn-dependent protease